MAKAICSIEGCMKSFHARQMCKAHYSAWRREQKGDELNAVRRKPKLRRVCLDCLEVFETHKVDKVICLGCYRKRMRFRTLECSYCGKSYRGHAKKKNDPDRLRNYCSTECFVGAHRWRIRKTFSTPVDWRDCRECGRPFISRGNLDRCRLCHEAGLLVVRLYGRRCARCGDRYESNQPTQRFCSPKCSRGWHRRLMRGRYGRHDTHRKRARRYGVEYEPVNKRKVFERDGYRCGICGRKTLKGAKVPHHRAPTIDHIIPLSEGGDHVYENVQCACFICNTRKGVHGANDQLLLVG